MNEIQLNKYKDIVYSSFTLHKNGLSAIGTPTFEQWEEVGKFIKKAEKSVHFWIGDWLNYGEQKYGEMYSQAIDATDYNYQTVANDKWIANRIKLSDRAETLGIKHYQNIASLDEDTRKEWIDKTVENNWSVSELKQHIKQHEARKNGEQSLKVTASLYGDNMFFNSSSKSDLRWDDHIIKDNTYPTITRLSRFYHKSGKEYSLREYARVQDFPDTYKFVGTYSSIKHQIGNAVSPKMAKFVGESLVGETFIDLFAGCGGLSCGLEMLNKRAIYANEIEPNYFQTYIFNHPDTQVSINDIHNISSKDISDVDIVVGGPPCQGFSTAGLRIKDDPRNDLYKEFLRIVKEKNVNEFLMENVPEIEAIKNQIIEDFTDIGYTVTFQIVKGEDIGMRQKRHRAFFIGKKVI